MVNTRHFYTCYAVSGTRYQSFAEWVAPPSRLLVTSIYSKYRLRWLPVFDHRVVIVRLKVDQGRCDRRGLDRVLSAGIRRTGKPGGPQRERDIDVFVSGTIFLCYR